MTGIVVNKSHRRLAVGLAAGFMLTATLGAVAFAGPASAGERRWEDRRWEDRRGHDRRWEERQDHHRDWHGGYYRAPPVIYGSPYYYPAPPVVYGPGFGLNLNIR